MMLNARFTALAVFCAIATQTAQAAVIARSPNDKSAAHYHDDGSSTMHAQSLFSFPWSKKADVASSMKHKVRMADLSPANPIQRVIDATFSRIQRSRGHQRRSRSHKSINYVVPNRRSDAPFWAADASQNATDASNSTATADAPEAKGHEGRSGYVAVYSPVYNQTEGRMIASLFLTNNTDGYVLDASETNKTKMYMVNAPSTSTVGQVASSSRDTVPVTLEMDVQKADSKKWCATYNPSPSEPEPMTVEPCVDAMGIRSEEPKKSQIFMYNGTSGEVRPTWYAKAEDNSQDPSISASSSYMSASTSMSDGDWSSTATSSSSSVLPSSSSAPLATRDAPSSQNVTLIFVPTTKTQNNAAAADINQDYTATSTVTQTVTVYSSTSAPASSIYAASVSASASVSTSTSASASPSASVTGLDVEIVGGLSTSASSPSSSSVPSSSSAPSSSFAVASATDAPSSAVSSSVAPSSSAASPPAPSIDAAAIAASIAVGGPSRASASASASRSASASASASGSASASASASSSSAYAVASAAASSSSASASASTSASDAASTTSSAFDGSSTGQASFVAAVVERDLYAASTDPYSWRFKAASK